MTVTTTTGQQQQRQSADQASRYEHRGEDEADVHHDVDLELTFLRRGCPVEPRRQTRRTEHGSTNQAEQEQRPNDCRERGDRTRRNALQLDERSKHERNRDDAPQRDAKDERPSPGLLRSVRECLWKQRQGKQEGSAHTDERNGFHRLPGRPLRVMARSPRAAAPTPGGHACGKQDAGEVPRLREAHQERPSPSEHDGVDQQPHRSLPSIVGSTSPCSQCHPRHGGGCRQQCESEVNEPAAPSEAFGFTSSRA